MSTDYIDEFVDRVDVIQVGARNMQNFDLLKQLGKTNKPILLKRGIAKSSVILNLEPNTKSDLRYFFISSTTLLISSIKLSPQYYTHLTNNGFGK